VANGPGQDGAGSRVRLDNVRVLNAPEGAAFSFGGTLRLDTSGLEEALRGAAGRTGTLGMTLGVTQLASLWDPDLDGGEGGFDSSVAVDSIRFLVDGKERTREKVVEALEDGVTPPEGFGSWDDYVGSVVQDVVDQVEAADASPYVTPGGQFSLDLNRFLQLHDRLRKVYVSHRIL